MENIKFKHEDTFIPVERIEVKRAYVIAQKIRWMNRGHTRYLKKLTYSEFQNRLQHAKIQVLSLSEDKLDEQIIFEKYNLRLVKAINNLYWYQGKVGKEEVGVWKGAGGLPVEWTEGSLADTTAHVSQELKNESTKGRARVIPRIIEHLDTIENEKYLYPIIVPGATHGRGVHGKPHKGFKLLKGDIYDGCMRSIAMVIKGKDSLNAYIGIEG